ncbi:hypothetical protein FOMPIDRAFT_1062303 [Fomitopsis schrenkii]|uniref:P-loop containing nucleoside triphosphate hydrolase protein n=1 Tax=Fomitopsis schrenkii TaxID=2126942 RepID=S8DYR1_FOMSC|nr:hypothetical protein FOMPIDRAFT_1062303 [Fomitopsis schrenkii]
MKNRVVFVGVGGATCSGKTTLAKHLRSILPGSVILHQDDFAPPQESVPVHPVYNVQDWDDAKGAIDWERMVKTLRQVKETGEIPPEHYSHDHLNEQKDVLIDREVSERWKKRFSHIEKEQEEKGDRFVWVIVDGFLLYWHPEVVEQLDVRVFLRVPHDVLKKRRHERHGYHTAEGSLWRDPPNYWEQIVWPAYVDAHKAIVEGGDVEHGRPSGAVPGLILIDGLEMGMSDIVEKVCARLAEEVEGKK